MGIPSQQQLQGMRRGCVATWETFMLKFRAGGKLKEDGTAPGRAQGPVLCRDALGTLAAAVPLHWESCAGLAQTLLHHPFPLNLMPLDS